MLHVTLPEKVLPVWAAIGTLDHGIRILSSHDPVFFTGDKASHLYEVLSGVLRVSRPFSDGRRQIISFAFPGDLVGFGRSDTYRFDCDALTEARVRPILRTSLLKVARERPEIGEKLLVAAACEIDAVHDLSMILCRKSALERVASFLVHLADRKKSAQGPVRLDVPMTRGDIADYLGLTLETVSRNFTKLRTMQVISLSGSGVVVIEDIDRLRALSECDLALQ